ncbi:MAG: hypothetical protein GY737_09095 [Desulfobacteraceae bacterium]|nr:hypothetical protein [Desulfobacteraceae bacterium]
MTNPLISGAWFKAMGAAYLLCMFMLGTVFIGTGEWEGLPMIAGIFALATGGIALVGLLIMLVVFGNRFKARFTVSERGVVYEGLDNRARSLARMGVMAGFSGGDSQAADPGPVDTSRERVSLDWGGAFSVRYKPRRHTVVLRNQWRDLMHLYCTADNYGAVRAHVEKMIREKGTRTRSAKRPSVLPKAIGVTLLVMLACLPLLALNDITRLDLFAPILILAFSLATIWLIPLFGWVVLPSVGYVLVQLAVGLTEYREFKLVNTYRYRSYEMLDSGEWIILLLALAALFYLARLSWRAVRGRLVPVLMQDMMGTGD